MQMHFTASLLIVLSLYTTKTWCQLTTTEPFYVYLDEAYTETLLPFAGYYIQFHNCDVATFKNRFGLPVDILGNPFVKPSRPTIGLLELLDNSKDLEVTCKYNIKDVSHQKKLFVPRVAYAKTSPHCSNKLTHCGNPQRSQRKHFCDRTSMGLDCTGYNAGKRSAFYTTTHEACVQNSTDIRFEVRSLGTKEWQSKGKAKDAVTFADELLLVQEWGGYYFKINSTEQGDIQCSYTECSFLPYQKGLETARKLTKWPGNMLAVTDALALHDMIKVECSQDITAPQGTQQISFPFYVVKNDSLTFICPSAQHLEPNCTAPIWLSEGTKRVTHISNGKYLCSYAFQLCYPNIKQLSLESTITCPISSSTRVQSSTSTTVESTAETSTSMRSKSTYSVTEPTSSSATTSVATTKETTQGGNSETTDKMTTATTAATSSEWGTNSTAATKEQTSLPITTKTEAQSTPTTADTTTVERTTSPMSTVTITGETTPAVTTKQTPPPVTTNTEGQFTTSTTYTVTEETTPSPTSDVATSEETTSAMTTEPTTPPTITKTVRQGASQTTEATTVDIPPSSTSTVVRETTPAPPTTEQTSPVTPAHSGRTSSTDGNGAGRGIGSGKLETSTPILYIILPVASGLLILIVALACINTQRKASRDVRQLAAPSEATDNRYVVVKQQEDIAMPPAQAASENRSVKEEAEDSPMSFSAAASETEDKPTHQTATPKIDATHEEHYLHKL